MQQVHDRVPARELAAERSALIAAARAAKLGPGATGNRGNWPPRYLEDTDESGNDCGDGQTMPFLGEADRKALQAGEEGSR